VLDKALAYLAELASKAAAPQKIDSGDRRRISYVVNGQVVSTETAPPPRGHSVKSLADVVALANRFAADDGKATDTDGPPAVWYDENAVVLVIDDDGHRLETATLALETSDVFRVLECLAKTKAKHDQKAFIRLLRVELAGTLDPVVLLEKVRKVRFENGVTTEAVSARQRESMGRSITSQVSTDGGDLPDEVTLSVPVYKTAGERAPVPFRCSVEVDPADGTFRLLPLPDELERVRQVAVARIAERLVDGLEHGTPAYYGSPGPN